MASRACSVRPISPSFYEVLHDGVVICRFSSSLIHKGKQQLTILREMMAACLFDDSSRRALIALRDRHLWKVQKRRARARSRVYH
jgi:hypothetical protein